MAVIVPARDAAGTIAEALTSVLAQDYAEVVEVAVAAADESTAAAVRGFTDRRVRLVANPTGSTAAGLNSALAATTAGIVVRCDAHTILPPGYVTRAVETLARTGADNVGGRQLPAGRTVFERGVGLAMTSPLGAGDARYRIGGSEGPTDTVYLGVLRRPAVEAAGGFDETLDRNQDYELNWRIRAAGGTVWFDPELAASYRPRGTVGALWHQYFDYGRWKRRVLRRHPESLRLRQLAAPALVVGLAASAIVASTPGRRLAALLPGAYLAVILGDAVATGLRRAPGEALVKPVALWVMHLAWGSGFLAGRLPGRRP